MMLILDENPNTDLMGFLDDREAKRGNTALIAATLIGFPEIVESLINAPSIGAKCRNTNKRPAAVAGMGVV